MNGAAGTRPVGTASEPQAAAWVQRMFANIAPRYDLANHLLSFNVDRRWRKQLVASLQAILDRPDATVLDLCCGTGDVLLDLQRAGVARVVGADFCHEMLVSARDKAAKRGRAGQLIEADALRLPMADETLDAIAIAFGFRNLVNYGAGLQELRRVLKPGGMLAILEFSHPQGWLLKTGYGLYSRFFLPAIGGLIAGSREAYAYLPESIRKFPDAPELARMMTGAGFTGATYKLLTGGIAALHVGRRPGA